MNLKTVFQPRMDTDGHGWESSARRDLECGDLSPLLRKRLVAVELPRASGHAGVPALARAVNAPSGTHASRISTATSRLGKAVTSHRTPKPALFCLRLAALVSSVSIRGFSRTSFKSKLKPTWRPPAFFLLLLGWLAVLSDAHAHESPVDHVDRTLTLWVQDGRLFVACRLQLTLRMALLQFHEADADRDGTVSALELAKLLEASAVRLRGLLRAEVGGRPLTWDATVRTTLEPGLAQRFVFSAPLGDIGPGRWEGRLSDGFSAHYPGHYRFLNTGEIPADAQRLLAEFAPETERLPGGHPARVVVKFTVATAP